MSLLVRDVRAITPTLMSGTPMTSLTTGGSGTFYSAPFHVGTFVELIAFINQVSHSGTNPTLDVSFDLSGDGKNWVASTDAFTQITTGDTVTFKRLTANFGDWMRVKFVVGGTATPTYVWSLVIMAKG